MKKLILLLFACSSLTLLSACSSSDDGHGHDHGNEHSHEQTKQHDSIN